MVKDPMVFMFDEPLSNLDAALRARMRHEIAKLHRRIGTTMIFVTHDQAEAMTLADRIVVMNQRRIEQIGTPLEIYTTPATLFVATFIGSPAMNVVPVTPVADGGARQSVSLSDGTRLQTRVPTSASTPLRLGVRPEAVGLCAAGDGDTHAVVEFVEFLGDKRHVYLVLSGGERLIALQEGSSRVREGEATGVRIDPEAVHLFDADGRSLPRMS
jgi:multiple sugar transport system ATP-binding protein